ncbi:MAG: membrane lipoprotein lipid attachment site-containing protein [Janthinobacterium lividum]
MKKIYFGAVLIVFLSGCASNMTPEPTQVTVSQNAGFYEIDRNLIDYHINKKKIRYKVRKSDSNSEKSPFLAREGKDFDKVNVSNVENSESARYRNFISNQEKFKNKMK